MQVFQRLRNCSVLVALSCGLVFSARADAAPVPAESSASTPYVVIPELGLAVALNSQLCVVTAARSATQVQRWQLDLPPPCAIAASATLQAYAWVQTASNNRAVVVITSVSSINNDQSPVALCGTLQRALVLTVHGAELSARKATGLRSCAHQALSNKEVWLFAQELRH